MTQDEEHRRRVQTIMDTSAKLLTEVERLRRDICRLHDRIDGDDELPKREGDEGYVRKVKDAKEAIEAIGEARDGIQGCEYHLSHMRGLVEALVTDDEGRSMFGPIKRRYS